MEIMLVSTSKLFGKNRLLPQERKDHLLVVFFLKKVLQFPAVELETMLPPLHLMVR